jgi:hypothetical protein
MFKKISLFILCICLSIVSNVHAEGVQLIASSEFDKGEISSRDIRKMFLGRYTRTDAGSVILPCYLSTEMVKTELYRVTKKTPETFRRYWNKRLFSGTGSAPKEFKDLEQLRHYMAVNRGAVCLFPSAADLPKDTHLVVQK